MPNRLVRLTVVATVGVVMAGAVTACSSSQSADRPRATTSATAASTTPAADPATELFRSLRTATARATTVHFVDSVDRFDMRKRAHFNFDATGDARFEHGKIVAARMKIETGGKRGDVIVSGADVYLRLAGRNGPGGKPWVRASERAPDDYLGLYAGFLLVSVPVSPTFASGLQPGATNVRKRLRTTDFGVTGTPYAMSVDPSKATGSAAALRKLADPDGRLDVTVTVDDKGRPARLVATERAGLSDLYYDATYMKYGRTVSVTAPPSSEIDS